MHLDFSLIYCIQYSVSRIAKIIPLDQSLGGQGYGVQAY